MDVTSEIRSKFSSLGLWHSMLLLLSLFTAYHVVTIIYRLTLHPLAKYPGPFFSKISEWSIAYQTTTGSRHLQQLKEHEIYGPIVRIGPNTVSVNTIPALKEIYANRKANVQKTAWYKISDAGTGAMSTHSEVNRERHAFRRRVFDHAFSDNAIRSAETFIIENIRNWCKHLGKGARHGEWTSAKNMSDWCTYVAYDTMGDLVFGKRFDIMESDEHRFVPPMLMSASQFIYTAAYIPLHTIMHAILSSPLMLSLGGQMARDNLRFITYSNSQIAKRKLAEQQALASGKPLRKDFVHYLLSASDRLTKEELDADSGLLISAGADTTSVTLAALFFYLIHNPSVLAQATKEVRAAFTDVEEIVSGPKLTSLVYTRSCIEETLRLSPPVTAHLPREVLAGGLTIDGHFFPEGTIVGTSAYAIHHNPEYYPEPFAFRPERWIVSTFPSEKGDSCTATGSREVTAQDVATAKAAFCAFSLGTRGCVGKSVGYLELILAAARMLWLFDIRKPEGAASLGPTGEGDPASVEEGRRRLDEYQLRDVFLSRREGPMVEFRRRAEGRA